MPADFELTPDSPNSTPVHSAKSVDLAEQQVAAAMRLLALIVVRYFCEEGNTGPKLLQHEGRFLTELLEMQLSCLPLHRTHPLAGMMVIVLVMFASLFGQMSCVPSRHDLRQLVLKGERAAFIDCSSYPCSFDVCARLTLSVASLKVEK